MSFAASSITHCACTPHHHHHPLLQPAPTVAAADDELILKVFVCQQKQASQRPSSVPKPNQCGRCGAICTADPFVQHLLPASPCLLPCSRFNDDFFSFSNRFLCQASVARSQFDLVTWSGVINWASDAETTIVFPPSFFSLCQLFHHCASWKAS